MKAKRWLFDMSMMEAFQMLFFAVFLGGYAVLAIALFWLALRDSLTELRERRRRGTAVIRENSYGGERKDADLGMPAGFLPAARSRAAS
jgi:hypothetical protein